MAKDIARLYPDEPSYRGDVRVAALRRKRPWHRFTDSADGRAMWREFVRAHDGDVDAALGELVAALHEGDLL